MNKERVLIFGYGQMAHFYHNYFSVIGVLSEISHANVTDIHAVRAAFSSFRPTVVINTASKTSLEWIQEHKDEALLANVLGAGNVAEVCAEFGAYHIYLSSGCIFESEDENDAKTEDDKPAPSSYYALTKVYAELALIFEHTDTQTLILRPRQPISAQVNYKNMLVKLLTFSQFVDTPNTGTVIEDLMQWTWVLIKRRETGVVHVANPGFSSPYQLALMLKEHVLPELPVGLFSKADLDAQTPVRRVDTVLDVTKLALILHDEGIEFHPYKARAEQTIIRLGEMFRSTPQAEVEIQLEQTMAQTIQRAQPNDVWKLLVERAM